MSVVTNVIVLPGSQLIGVGHYEEERRLHHVLVETEFSDQQTLREITMGCYLGEPTPTYPPHGHWGGSKVPECYVYAAAFNYLNWQEFKEWIERLPWAEPDHVRVLVKGDSARAFEVWTLVGRRLEQCLGGAHW